MPDYHCLAVGVKSNAVKPVAREYQEKIHAKDFEMAATIWLNKLRTGPEKEGYGIIEFRVIDLKAAQDQFTELGIKTKPMIDIKGNKNN